MFRNSKINIAKIQLSGASIHTNQLECLSSEVNSMPQ